MLSMLSQPPYALHRELGAPGQDATDAAARCGRRRALATGRGACAAQATRGPTASHGGQARGAFDRAIALANTSAEAAHIRMHLDRAESPTYFVPVVSPAQWETCGRFPESAEEFTEHWTELRGAEDAPLPKSLVNATLEFVEKGLGAQSFSGEVPVFTYTL